MTNIKNPISAFINFKANWRTNIRIVELGKLSASMKKLEKDLKGIDKHEVGVFLVIYVARRVDIDHL
ncbi:Peroxisomal membrane protein 11C [Bienertia sinuspersici]